MRKIAKIVAGVLFEATFAGCRAENERFFSKKIRDGSKSMPRKIFAIFLLAIFLIPFLTHAESTGIEVNLGVSGCNNNGICEPGETAVSCPVDCAIVVPPPSGGSSGYMPKDPDLYIYNISIQPNFTNAFIYWSSSISTISSVKWGKTTDVSEGEIQSVAFAQNHKMELINLKSGTLYYFVIESKDVKDRINIHPPIYFFTKFEKDTAFPLNPLNPKAVAEMSGIHLSWTNPPDKDFSYIRITRHEDRFRGDPFLGKLIYEGKAEKFLDTNVAPGKKYFYTFFTRNNDGKFSSGVGASATAYSPKEIFPPVDPAEITKETPPEVLISETFFVHQYNQQVEPLTTMRPAVIASDKNTIIDINTKTRPDDIAKITDQYGNIVGQYLFSFNADSGRYQSVLPPLQKAGIYNVKIYRYRDNLPMIISEGYLEVEEKTTPKIEEFGYNIFRIDYMLIILPLFLLFFMIFLLKRMRKAQQK